MMLRLLSQPLSRPVHWRSIIADVVLLALVIGPIAAPFLAAFKIFPFPLIGSIIYFLGEHVCPQPEMGLVLLPPNLMAVCMRCYGVLLALVTARLLYASDRGNGFYWLNQYRFRGAAIATILTFAYPVEMIAQILGWWSYNNYAVTSFGYLTGLGIGLFVAPVLYGESQHSATVD
jgi:uncharacterized membrane protein